MAAERTFIAIKPDGVQRGLVGEILGRFERKGFKLVGLGWGVWVAAGAGQPHSYFPATGREDHTQEARWVVAGEAGAARQGGQRVSEAGTVGLQVGRAAPSQGGHGWGRARHRRLSKKRSLPYDSII